MKKYQVRCNACMLQKETLDKDGEKCPRCGVWMVQVPDNNTSEYTVVPLDQVRPGDVAVCNGREFPVIEYKSGDGWALELLGRAQWVAPWDGFDALGFEFRRPVPREPWKSQQLVGVAPSGVITEPRYAKDGNGNVSPGYRIFLADITEVME